MPMLLLLIKEVKTIGPTESGGNGHLMIILRGAGRYCILDVFSAKEAEDHGHLGNEKNR